MISLSMPKSVSSNLPDIILTDNKTVGERISEVRKSRGFTQKELADKLSIKRSTLADYEASRSRIFDELITRLSIVLKVSPARLLGLEPQKSNDEKVPLRYTKRIKEIEKLPEHKRRAVLKTLDDSIKANKE